MLKDLLENEKKVNLTTTVDKQVKEKLEEFKKDNNISLSKLVNVIYKKIIKDGHLDSIENLEKYLQD